MTSTTRTSFRAVAVAAALSMLWVGLLVAATPPASAALNAADVLADFEGPSTPPEFFVFNGGSSVVATPITVADTDPLARPGEVGPNDVLQVDYNVFDFGGLGQSFAAAGPQDWSGYASFDLWFHGSGSGLAYQLELSENRSDPGLDTSERFDHTFVDDVPGWRHLSVPFADFTRATDFQPGGAPDDGFTGEEIWAWAIVLPQGTDTVYVDDVAVGVPVIDDFESGLPNVPGPPQVGFSTFNGAGSSVTISTESAPPGPVRHPSPGPTTLLRMDVDSTSFAGFIHAFQAPDGSWTSQDWSGYAGFRLWLHGTGSGSQMFVDLLENRNPGSTTDDAERWTKAFVDDFTGWRLLEFPFSQLTRKEIGNGAPNDGLTLDRVWGYAVGTLGTGGARTFFIDDVQLYGIGEVPPLRISLAVQNTRIPEGTTGEVRVRLNRPLADGDPDQVSVDFATEETASIAVAGREYTPTSGTLTFVKGGPSELGFAIETFDDSKWEGDERIVVRLSNFVGAERGAIAQGSAFIVDSDPYDPDVIDDFERGAHLWSTTGDVALAATEVAAGGPGARPGQDAVENVLRVDVDAPLRPTMVIKGSTCSRGNGVVPVHLLSSATFDAMQVDHTTVRFGAAAEAHTHGRPPRPTRHVEDVNRDGRMDLVFHFRVRQTGYDCTTPVRVLTGRMQDGREFVSGGPVTPATFGRDFAIGQDWQRADGLSFWFEGTGSGRDVTLVVKDNRAPDPGPAGWDLVWSDEFDEPAGTPPNPASWNFEIGDVTPDGKNGWGNEELQYYTDDPANAATDGNGNLAITLRDAEGLECYYGPCRYTSARLTSWNKAEFAYGRIESRIKVPGGEGIWPAFWSLGTDIDVVSWPQTGEIDFMEFVGRLPGEIFGTIHGPGYAGGASFSGIYDDFGGEDVPERFHTYAVEWEPDLIRWYINGIQFHEARPEDVAPNEWVFNDPVFLLLNVAAGGNFGGAIGPSLQPPASMLVDYVRVYQGPDTAERWQATFTDEVAGWQRVTVPFEDLVRAGTQPPGAPDDGLGLSEVWGYAFELPDGGSGYDAVGLDLVELRPRPKPAEVTVTSASSGGPGSLRDALGRVADGGTITFDPALAGQTVALSAPIEPTQAVTIDASAAPGLTLSGGGSVRVLVVPAGVDVTVRGLTIANGYGFQLAGGVLNNGALTLDRVTVSGNTMTTPAGDFWQGGGGIYSGDGATLRLVDSTVSGNSSGWTGGGVYSFFNTTTEVVRSTISGNSAADVGGGLRTLGSLSLLNSTVSGNTAAAWHGAAMFVTDGVADVSSTTIAGNSGPGGTAAVFVGTFTAASATLRIRNSVVAGNTSFGCFLAPFGAGAVALESLGGNVFGDGTCFHTGADQVVGDALLGPLADNGGPTRTHALLAGSPAVGAADPGTSPATDQRGVARDPAPDAGAFERQ